MLQSIKILKASQEVFFLLSKASRNPGELITFKTPCRSHMGIYSVLSLKKNFSVEMGKGKCSCEALAFIKKWSCQVNQVKLTSTILWSCDSVKSTARVCSKEYSILFPQNAEYEYFIKKQCSALRIVPKSRFKTWNLDVEKDWRTRRAITSIQIQIFPLLPPSKQVAWRLDGYLAVFATFSYSLIW